LVVIHKCVYLHISINKKNMKTKEQIEWEVMILETTMLKVKQEFEEGKIDEYAYKVVTDGYRTELKVLNWVLGNSKNYFL